MLIHVDNPCELFQQTICLKNHNPGDCSFADVTCPYGNLDDRKSHGAVLSGVKIHIMYSIFCILEFSVTVDVHHLESLEIDLYLVRGNI